MSIPSVRVSATGEIYSPFSGLAVDGETVDQGNDATVLFVYFGGAPVWGYVSHRVTALLGGKDVEELAPQEVSAQLSLTGAFVLEVDSGWNGVNYYCFAPATSE